MNNDDMMEEERPAVQSSGEDEDSSSDSVEAHVAKAVEKARKREREKKKRKAAKKISDAVARRDRCKFMNLRTGKRTCDKKARERGLCRKHRNYRETMGLTHDQKRQKRESMEAEKREKILMKEDPRRSHADLQRLSRSSSGTRLSRPNRPLPQPPLDQGSSNPQPPVDQGVSSVQPRVAQGVSNPEPRPIQRDNIRNNTNNNNEAWNELIQELSAIDLQNPREEERDRMLEEIEELLDKDYEGNDEEEDDDEEMVDVDGEDK